MVFTTWKTGDAGQPRLPYLVHRTDGHRAAKLVEQVLLQHKEVRANPSISAIRSPYYPFLEESAMLGVIDAAVVGAGRTGPAPR